MWLTTFTSHDAATKHAFTRPTAPQEPLATDYQRLWIAIASATEGAKVVQTLAEILTDKDGGAFISWVDSKDAEFRYVEILGTVSHDLRLPSFTTPVSQGPIATKHNLRAAENQAFFIALRRSSARLVTAKPLEDRGRIRVSDERCWRLLHG